MIKSINRKIACAPFEKHSIEIETKRGFATVKTKTELVSLKVVFNGDDYFIEPGDTVWVRGEQVKSVWAGEEFQVGDSKFILVPQDAIVLHEGK